MEILSQDSQTVTVASSQILANGARILFDGTTYGYVSRSLGTNQYEVILTKATPVSQATQLTWWAKSFRPAERLVSKSFFVDSDQLASMNVQCSRSQLGYLSWQLFHNSTLIARGNDMRSPGWCKFTAVGLFPIGTYRLEVTQRYKSVTLATASTSWVVEAPAQKLECGAGKAKSILKLQ